MFNDANCKRTSRGVRASGEVDLAADVREAVVNVVVSDGNSLVHSNRATVERRSGGAPFRVSVAFKDDGADRCEVSLNPAP